MWVYACSFIKLYLFVKSYALDKEMLVQMETLNASNHFVKGT